MPPPQLPRLLGGTLVAAALVSIAALEAPVAWMPAHYVAKPLATLSILALAITAANPLSARYQRALAAGLVMSLVGDVLLMAPADLFAFGLGAFLLAHLCYLAAFLGESRLLARPIALVGYSLVALALMAAVYPSLPAALRVPVMLYVVVITLMATQSAVWLLDTPSTSSRRAAVGAAWFLVSDATLAIDRFRTDVPFRHVIVLGTYFIAQWYLARSVSRADS